MNPWIRFLGSPFAAIFRSVPKIVAQPSLWPEAPRKSPIRRYAENLCLRFRDHAVCLEYNGLGLDLRGHDLRDVITEGWRVRHIEPRASQGACDYTCVLVDKELFRIYFSAKGLPTVPTLGVGTRGGSDALLERLAHERAFFMKPVGGICGMAAHVVLVKDGRFVVKGQAIDLKALLGAGGSYLFQPIVTNHPAIRRLNSSTLNTVRVMTCWDRRAQKAALWCQPLLRVGRARGEVDNFFMGGLLVAIRADGTLGPWGISHTPDRVFSKTRVHPDSGVVFEGLPLPYFRETIALALEAQRHLPMIPSIGWDVAITETGPVLLEGQHDWDVVMAEIAHAQGQMARYREIYC